MSLTDGFLWVDIALAVLVLLFFLNGLRRGLCRELAHILTFAALIAGFCFFYAPITEFAACHCTFVALEHIHIAVPVMMLSAALVVYILIWLCLRALLCPFLDFLGEKFLGGIVGAARGAVFGLVIIAALTLVQIPAVQEAVVDKSVIGCWVENTITPWLKETVTMPETGCGDFPLPLEFYRRKNTDEAAGLTQTNTPPGNTPASANQQSTINNDNGPQRTD
ncbi:MAG: CvpA family protein [Kiritimatiellales bacterium]